MGTFDHRPTPRFASLAGWIANELRAHDLTFGRGVPALLADLFGEDLPGIASEIEKLAVLEGELDEERVRRIVNRPAARDAFDLGRLKDTDNRPFNYALEVCAGLAAACAEAMRPQASIESIVAAGLHPLSSTPKAAAQEALGWAEQVDQVWDLRPLFAEKYRGHPASAGAGQALERKPADHRGRGLYRQSSHRTTGGKFEPHQSFFAL